MPQDLPGADQHAGQGPARVGEGALALAHQFKEAAPETPVIFTVHELKRLARNAAELQAGGIQLELLTGIYDPNGMGAMFFTVLAVAGQIERNHIREKTLEGQVIAAATGNHGGRPKVIDEDMLTFAVEALAAQRAHIPFREGICPRRPDLDDSRAVAGEDLIELRSEPSLRHRMRMLMYVHADAPAADSHRR